MAQQEAIWTHFQGDGIDKFNGAYWRLSRLVHYASRYYSKPDVLNIGIGDGSLELYALRRGWKVIAVDPDEGAVNRLRAKSVDARSGFIEQLPVETSCVDVVFASEVFEHLTDKQLTAGLEEIWRVLRSNGRLFGTTPFAENLKEQECVCPRCGIAFHRWGHEQSFKPERMREILNARFSVEICEPRHFPNWKAMDLRSKTTAVLRRLLRHPFGIHRPDENILFIARK